MHARVTPHNNLTKNGYKLNSNENAKNEPGGSSGRIIGLVLEVRISNPRNPNFEEIIPIIIIRVNGPFRFPSPTNNNTEDNRNP
jgi:hypothetical protein